MRRGRIVRKKKGEPLRRTRVTWFREIGQLRRAIVGREMIEGTSNKSGDGAWDDVAIVTAIRAMARLRRHEGDTIDRMFDDMTTKELDESSERFL